MPKSNPPTLLPMIHPSCPCVAMYPSQCTSQSHPPINHNFVFFLFLCVRSALPPGIITIIHHLSGQDVDLQFPILLRAMTSILLILVILLGLLLFIFIVTSVTLLGVLKWSPVGNALSPTLLLIKQLWQLTSTRIDEPVGDLICMTD